MNFIMGLNVEFEYGDDSYDFDEDEDLGEGFINEGGESNEEN
jgi:hypothetical protein